MRRKIMKISNLRELPHPAFGYLLSGGEEQKGSLGL
jgi:hypothetical protein